MKSALLLTTILLSLSVNAFQDGTYTCGSRAGLFEAIYKIKTITVDGINLPYFEVTKNNFKNPNDPTAKDRSYQISGIATIFTDSEGQETLVLGNVTIDLTAGKVTCK